MEKPKIRFGQFNDKWKKNKLDTVVDFYDNQRIPIDSGERKAGPYPYYGASGIIDYVDGYIFNGEYVLLAEDGANIILRSSPIAYLIKGKFWLNNHAHIMKVKTGSNEFLIQLLEKQNYEKYNTGTAQPKLNGEVVKKISLHFPSDDEQSAIGSFFRTLDDLLASYKDNLANYQSLKATMLSKMFPKAGQKVPEIRLDGFEGEWEEKKLGEIVDIIGGGTPDTNVKEYWNGEINWFSPTEVGNSIYLDTSEKRISELGLQKSSAKILPANRTILFTSRAGIGSVGIITKDSTTNQGFQSLVTKQGIDIYFLFSYSSEITRYALKHSAGSTFLEISGKELGKMDIIIPTYEEQQAIGAYFSNLDNLISAHQEKISQLETLKKKLLQDMFI